MLRCTCRPLLVAPQLGDVRQQARPGRGWRRQKAAASPACDLQPLGEALPALPDALAAALPPGALRLLASLPGLCFDAICQRYAAAPHASLLLSASPCPTRRPLRRRRPAHSAAQPTLAEGVQAKGARQAQRRPQPFTPPAAGSRTRRS